MVSWFFLSILAFFWKFSVRVEVSGRFSVGVEVPGRFSVGVAAAISWLGN